MTRHVDVKVKRKSVPPEHVQVEEGVLILLSLLEKMKIRLYYMLIYQLVPYCMTESALQEK